MKTQEQLKNKIATSLKKLDLSFKYISLEHPDRIDFGDYSTNVAMLLAKDLKTNPLDLAEKIKSEIEREMPVFLEKIEVAKPGFINFYFAPVFFKESLENIIKEKENFGKNNSLKGQKIIIEHTDPNPFKEFHIGHLMTNTIGESLSRIIGFNGANVKTASYQGDLGLHVAKAVAFKIKENGSWQSAQDVAVSYGLGAKKFETDEDFKKFTTEINKKIYEKSDSEINKIYELGKNLTQEHFEEIYKILDTNFDFNFFESQSGEFGKKVVSENKDIFEESEGAIIFRGEKYDKSLHTRVFVNKDGLPTYEAKELGLAKIKYDKYPYDISVVITGNEVNDYFRVLLKAMELLYPDLAEKTRHISHGMLRFATGKMSSRTGDVITAEALIDDVESKVSEIIEKSEKNIEDQDSLKEEVAVGAIKYSILKQSIGKDIIFDLNKSISFEGDSGPYLQYTNARINSLLEKANDENIKSKVLEKAEIFPIEKLIYQFPEIVERSCKERAPQLIVSFLIELAGSFNNFYANNKIVDKEDALSPHKIAITEATGVTLKNGLYLLGIKTPFKM